MKIIFVSIFPEIFDSFLSTSLIFKAINKWILDFNIVNPRDFCVDKHKQVDDEIYWWWDGMLIKAEPVIQAVEFAIQNWKIWKKFKKSEKKLQNFKIVFLTPSKTIFDQQIAHQIVEDSHDIIFVCGRYEWIDYRFQQYFAKKYPDNFVCMSLWKFVTLGGEFPAMTMCESIVRLIPWVIKEEGSWQDESYNINKNMQNIEYPQYTRPSTVGWINVPEILLSWHHKKIEEWRIEKES